MEISIFKQGITYFEARFPKAPMNTKEWDHILSLATLILSRAYIRICCVRCVSVRADQMAARSWHTYTLSEWTRELLIVKHKTAARKLCTSLRNDIYYNQFHSGCRRLYGEVGRANNGRKNTTAKMLFIDEKWPLCMGISTRITKYPQRCSTQLSAKAQSLSVAKGQPQLFIILYTYEYSFIIRVYIWMCWIHESGRRTMITWKTFGSKQTRSHRHRQDEWNSPWFSTTSPGAPIAVPDSIQSACRHF